jgi:nucleoside-diphosphate-sugar epimerase
MKTFITGATGFIGSHLVEALRRNHRDVRCLVRKNCDREHLKKLGVEFVFGDLLDKDSLKKAVQGVNVVYHLAGKVFARNAREFFAINVTGTKNLIEASLSNGIDKFVYFSSIAAVGPNINRNTLLSENSPCKPVTAYGRSKCEAEKLIKEFSDKFSDKYKLSTVIIRPPMVYGPGAVHCRSSKLFRMISKKRFAFIGNGENNINTCFIENLIQGILLLEQREGLQKNNIYFFGDEEIISFREFVKIIADEGGIRMPDIHLSVPVAKCIALISQEVSRLFRFTPSITLDTIQEVINDWNYDMTFTKRELGYMPKVKLIDGVKRTIAWYGLGKHEHTEY